MPEWWLLAIVRIAIHQRPEGRVSCHCLDWTEFSTWKVMTIWSSHSAGVWLRWGLRGPVEKTRGVSSCPPDASGFLWHSRQEFIHSLMNSSHGSPVVLCQKESVRFWAICSCACFSVSQRKWKWKSPNLKLITKRYTRKEVYEKTLTISETSRKCLGEDGRWKRDVMGVYFGACSPPGCLNNLHPSNLDQNILASSVFWNLFFLFYYFYKQSDSCAAKFTSSSWLPLTVCSHMMCVGC